MNPIACVGGSTPAHAGNTEVVFQPSRAPAVYPRPRGEYDEVALPSIHLLGLPPPTRGIRNRSGVGPDDDGSTPAHAGNTASAALCRVLIRVYPRPRGEY